MNDQLGNVCPARPQLLAILPHEPDEDILPVISPFARPIKLLICKHCGVFYAVVNE